MGRMRSDRPYPHHLLDRKRLAIGLGLCLVIGFLCIAVLIPAGVRALPGRYAARLPDFLLNLRHRDHPELLPTPMIGAALSYTPLPPATALLRGVTFVTSVAQTSGATEQVESGIGYVLTQEPSERSTRVVAGTPSEQETATPTPRPTLVPDATSTPTATPTPTDTATPTPTAVLTPTPLPLPISAQLPPITHTYQTWNNCGPATLSMALQYLGWKGTQADTASVLKPDPEDKNVSPYEMQEYIHSLGLDAVLRVGGDLTRLKRLIAAGFPVIVETWFIPEPGDQMGHYRLLTGYDDRAGHFVAQDSYNGPNLPLDYAAFDELWRVFDRVYLVLLDSSRADQLAAILGEDADDGLMFLGALDVAVAETVQPTDECVAYENCADMTAFAWFNVGTNLTSLARHEEAATAYDQARVLGLPWRMLWYQFGPYESYYSIGRFDDVITLATATLAPVGNLEESYYWRGLAYLAKDDVNRARSDFQAAVKYNPGFDAAVQALAALD
jgi:tetratricopeptide (TPR) repeat protein